MSFCPRSALSEIDSSVYRESELEKISIDEVKEELRRRNPALLEFVDGEYGRVIIRMQRIFICIRREHERLHGNSVDAYNCKRCYPP